MVSDLTLRDGHGAILTNLPSGIVFLMCAAYLECSSSQDNDSWFRSIVIFNIFAQFYAFPVGII